MTAAIAMAAANETKMKASARNKVQGFVRERTKTRE
jgi:hypothetical protein